MDLLYIDTIGGASGDMLIGAFLDTFVPFDYFKSEIGKLNLPEYRLTLEDTQRHHIGAKKFTVISQDHKHRHLHHIVEMIESSGLSDYVQSNSIKAFTRLGEHEAKIHQMPIEKVHFHEVGAVDSIIDIVGFFICIDYLKPAKVYASPLPMSQGTVKAAHGILPVPAPATLALLKKYPLKKVDVEGELVTPTGAVLLSEISDGLLPLSLQFKVERIGYGCGSKNFKEIANLLRVWSGTTSDAGGIEQLLQIETNIDDMNPEIYPHLQEKLFELGANDVSFQQCIMKKGRPGTLVSILAEEKLLDSIRTILYRETTTIGFRYFPVFREKLPRESREIDSAWGKIKVKVIHQNEDEILLPEYEECKRIARNENLSLKEIYQKINDFLKSL